jgi:hypothetical protein
MSMDGRASARSNRATPSALELVGSNTLLTFD